jgi:hypothetical protein
MDVMTRIKAVCLAGAVVIGLAASVSPALADGLPADVKQQVAASVAAWHSDGNVDALSATIADLCVENPGIALDVVAYAGEVAASSGTPERCLVSDSKCSALDDLLAVLYAQALQVSSGGTRTASVGRILPPPPPPGGGTDGGIGGGTGDGGGSAVGGGGSGEGSGDPDNADMPPPPPPCQAAGLCGGEPPPVSLSSL